MIDYYLLTKPGIIMGNLVTVAAGFLLASHGEIDVWLCLATLIGLTLVMASACVWNNYIDRPFDKKMKRTKNRALVTGAISVRHAILFAILLGLLGSVILLRYTNVLTFAVAAVGFFVYVVLYSMWKGHTIYGTAIGSVAGAVPPVVGYCAVSNQLDSGAVILFFMMILWQMPHFFSIALFHFDDYVSAKIPVLPVMRGVWRTKVHMVVYIAAFVVVAGLLTLYGYTGFAFLAAIGVVGLLWLGMCVSGFSSTNDHLWGYRMYRLSLLMIMVTCVMISLDRV